MHLPTEEKSWHFIFSFFFFHRTKKRELVKSGIHILPNYS